MYLFTITAEHVKRQKVFPGANAPLIERQAAQARSAIGHIQPLDIGKRVYRNGVVQVENDEQRDARMAKL